MEAATWLSDLAARSVVDPTRRGSEARRSAFALMEELDHPQRHAPAVHVVGTAGKGSVATGLTARLVAGGRSVATHQSPHVHDVRERFLLDGGLVSWARVDSAAQRVAAAMEAATARLGTTPGYFAATAALSWELGRVHGVDVFVTEAGIGGRNDATAVLDRADTITAVTTIGFDHTDVLGDRIAAIAAEKLAVIAGRRVAVLGPQRHPEVIGVARELAAQHGVELEVVDGTLDDWRLVAGATVDALARRVGSELGWKLPAGELRLPPGRLEVHETGDRRVMLDGAHNPLKLEALHEVIGSEAACVVAAIGATKDLDGCARVLAGFGVPVIATELGGPGPRCRPAHELAAAVARHGAPAEACRAVVDAVREARALTGSGDTILVTGSFLLLADVLDVFAATPGEPCG